MVDSLNGVTVKDRQQLAADPKSQFQPGSKVIPIDSEYLQMYSQQSLANLLNQITAVFVKSYGFNSYSTLSFRGASAAQSMVYWQGIPLMNAATGVTDISLLPVVFSDSISLQYGSNAAMMGSGNVGGALLLSSREAHYTLKGHWSGGVEIGVGSYSQFPAEAEIAYMNSRWALRIKAIRQQSTNNFQAQDLSGNTFEMQHASINGEGVVLDLDYRINSRNQLSLHAWQQDYQREIPAALFESRSVKNQEDASIRGVLEWRHRGRKVGIYAKLARLQDQFDYNDADISLTSHAVTQQYYTEWGMEGSINNNWNWILFTPLQFMELDGTSEKHQDQRLAIAGNIQRSFLQKRLIFAINGREEWYGAKSIGLPGIGASYRLLPDFIIRAGIQASYRAPTLNELFYQPGGNSELKAEHGWSEDAGYLWTKGNGGLGFSHGLSVYNRNIKDWIIWLGGSIWTPHNLEEVHSRGLETENRLSGKWGAIRWEASLNAAYTRSSPTASYLGNDHSVGMQIPYTPVLTGTAGVGMNWKSLGIRYMQNYNGKRYITSDESEYLPYYSVGNLIISYLLHVGGSEFYFHGSIQNVWNTTFQVVAYRPLPRRNFLFSLAFRRP